MAHKTKPNFMERRLFLCLLNKFFDKKIWQTVETMHNYGCLHKMTHRCHNKKKNKAEMHKPEETDFFRTKKTSLTMHRKYCTMLRFAFL